MANVQAGYVDLANVKELVVAPHAVRRHLLRAGDVLMTEGGDIDKLGRGCIWRGQIDPCAHQNHVFAVRCGSRIRSDYLVYMMESSLGRRHFFETAKKTTNLASTNSTNVSNFAFPLPAIDIQKATVESLNGSGLEHSQLITSSRSLELILRERRSALITAAVTGQIDVATYARAEPAESATT
ncbi:hypothetical protein BH23ACT6_BH23ACT6_06250 [soil metagenome]